MYRFKFLFILFFVISLLSVIAIDAKCGYQSCHPSKKDRINVHLIAHSHDDTGWLKTFEQYYYGSHDNVHYAGVQYILDSVVDALEHDIDRRFIYAEIGFFWKWWLYQDATMKGRVKRLVENGQLEFVGGGWSMNDEATTNYQNIIDQMSWGLRKLNETFGDCGRPRVAWQIDPFGHSREMASIAAQMGFDGFFLDRADYQDHELREANGTLEMVWRGDPDDLGDSTDIYTHVLLRHYNSPSGLCFDIRCTDEPIVDDPASPEYNVEQKVKDFIKSWIEPSRKGYSSNNIHVTMGGDFQYQYAGKNFLNMDKLIKYMNGREIDGVKYNVMYSTPSCYLKAVYEATNGTLKAALKTDDFLPYASAAHNYWTGYYSSRPTGKGYSRYSNNFLQIAKQLSVLTNSTSPDDLSKLDTLREALGIFQHHDAITGTERENVAHDYIRLLHNGNVKCEEVARQALAALTKAPGQSFTTCPLLNISECATTENAKNFVITLYNPLGSTVNKYVRLPVTDNGTEIYVTDPDGKRLLTQFVPIHPSVINVPGRNSSAKYELVFYAEDIPPLGFKSYFVEKTANVATTRSTFETGKATGKGKQAVSRHRRLDLSIGIAYYYYTGFDGDGSSAEKSPSQPYVFRPDPNVPIQPISHDGDRVTYYGPVINETHWTLNEWFSYIVRPWEDGNCNEFVHLVGPLPYDNRSIEVVIRFITDLEYEDKFRTDTNGRGTIERIRNFRPTWDVNVTEPVAGNYYPIVSHISVTNGSTAGFAVLNDRAEGGGSVEYQTLELMIHRNTKRGGAVGEALNEQAYGTGVVSRGSHYLVFTGSDYTSDQELTPKEVARRVSLNSWPFFSTVDDLSFEFYREAHVMEYSGLGSISLPRNVHILTLEPWSSSEVLLRLENFFGKEDGTHSGSSTVNIQSLFAAFEVVSLRETTLDGNQWLEHNSRIRFNSLLSGRKATKRKPIEIQKDNDFDVTLAPMQIRTFIVTISYYH